MCAWREKNREQELARSAAYYRAHKAENIEASAKWAKEHPEKRKEAQKKWLKNNPKRRKEVVARHHQKVKAKRNAQIADWKRKNKEKNCAYSAKRRALKKKAIGSYTGADVKRIYSLQRGVCAVCRTALGNKYDQDHIIPLSCGGTNYPNNIQLLCEQCNCTKHAKDPIDFMQSRGYLL